MEAGLFNLNCFVIEYGRHTYWTNILCDFTGIPQKQDFVQHGIYIGNKDLKDDSMNTREGGYNVHQVIEYFINLIERK